MKKLYTPMEAKELLGERNGSSKIYWKNHYVDSAITYTFRWKILLNIPKALQRAYEPKRGLKLVKPKSYIAQRI